MNQKEIIELIKARKELSLFIGIALLTLISFFIHPATSEKKETQEPIESFDTYIPEGHSLLPIEVANYETLDSLLGPFGVVDIFTVPQSPTDKALRIAYRVKILRAPRNPSHFAILVPFERVKSILKYAGPFMVSVQNPKSSGTSFVNEPVKTKSRILYNLGD